MNKRALAWTIFAIDIASLLVAGWFAWVTRNASLTSGGGWSGSGFLAGLLFALSLLPFPIVGLLIRASPTRERDRMAPARDRVHVVLR